MIEDLVKRLRAEDPECGLRHSLAMEAADCIEELQKFKSLHAKCDETSLAIELKLVETLAMLNKRIGKLQEENERYRLGLIEIVQMERVPMGNKQPDYVTKTGTFANDLRNKNWPQWMIKKEDKNV